ncbi:preprotein translocase subunit YajC [Anaplasma phagocytophilum]|nr:preprotein translocase subunit YajC [Anaplasma phagocytophilum]
MPPQQKKLEERNKLLESLKRGDKTDNNPLVYTCICFYEASPPIRMRHTR